MKDKERQKAKISQHKQAELKKSKGGSCPISQHSEERTRQIGKLFSW